MKDITAMITQAAALIIIIIIIIRLFFSNFSVPTVPQELKGKTNACKYNAPRRFQFFS
jgi:hypothetical protein